MGRLIPAELPDGARIALDTVPFVHLLELHSAHAPLVEELLLAVETGRVTAAISSLVLTELLVPAWRSGDAAQADRVIRGLINFPNLEILEVSAVIAAEAARLRALHGLRTPDAIHAATAFASGAGALVTNDRDFLRLEPALAVLLLG